MLILTQDGDYIKWESVTCMFVSRRNHNIRPPLRLTPYCKTGYDLNAVISDNTTSILAHFDDRDEAKELMKAIVSASFDEAYIVDCSNGNIYKKRGKQ